ncbi:hypothetical protein [Massilia sp. TWP1-3-3]|uniref:hypothetical protein n=1 Tax=Massilia sp. TWP1-3-3 TaxID=2804573 RepID=UPI003CF41BA4
MKLNINKAAQGPVLAKGDEPTPGLNCPTTATIADQSTAYGCTYTTTSGVSIFAGGNTGNGGTGGIQVSGSTNCCG